MSLRITYDPETRTYLHAKKSWANTYPIERLPEWIAFYKKQRLDFPKSGTSYDADIAALEDLARQLGIPV